jgi:hypothetical protein
VETQGHLEISIKGKKGKIDIKPDNYDIKEIIALLQNVESLLFPEKKGRPVISYEIKSGSVKHIVKTSLQAIIGFNAVLGQIAENNEIDFLEYSTAKAIEEFQESAIKHDYEIDITTSLSDSAELKVTKETNFKRKESLWIEAEFYFYGRITNMGGKDKANIHIVTDDLGTLLIQTPKEWLAKLENNPLYKKYGIRAVGKQNLSSGEIDRSTLRFLEIIDYHPKYDEEYLTKLRNSAGAWLNKIDPDKWLSELRGGYEA